MNQRAQIVQQKLIRHRQSLVDSGVGPFTVPSVGRTGFVPGQPLVLRTMNGFGDMLWLLTAIANIKSVYSIPHLTLVLQRVGDHRDDRALDFVRRFDMVDVVRSQSFTLRQSPPIYRNRLRYVPDGYNGDGSYTLNINPYLEWAGRLEAFLPDLPPDWGLMANRYRPDATTAARGLAGTAPYGCLHLGCVADNTVQGMNRGGLWTAADWIDLVRLLKQDFDVPFYVVGSDYDREYAEIVLGGLPGVVNLCGKTGEAEVVELLRRAEFMASFASGMGVLSTYLGTPTAMFWRPEGASHSAHEDLWFSDSFATNWVSPTAIGESYYPAVYTKDTPASVHAALLKFSRGRKSRS